jgi:hypothetical protein
MHSLPCCRALRQEVAAYHSLHQGLLSSATSRRGTRDTVGSVSVAGFHPGSTPAAQDMDRQYSSSSVIAAGVGGPSLQEGLLALEGAGEAAGMERDGDTTQSGKHDNGDDSHADGLDELLRDASQPVRTAVVLLRQRYVHAAASWHGCTIRLSRMFVSESVVA